MRIFKLNDKLGLKDDKCKVILEPIFDAIWLGLVDEGFIEAGLNEKWGLFDTHGNCLLPIKYDSSPLLVRLYQKKLKIKEDLLK